MSFVAEKKNCHSSLDKNKVFFIVWVTVIIGRSYFCLLTFLNERDVDLYIPILKIRKCSIDNMFPILFPSFPRIMHD